jgi:hypothetical protein
VSRLQNRIYKATIDGKTDVIHNLKGKIVNSLDAKLMTVRNVTTLSNGNRNAGVDKTVYETPQK